MTNEYRGKKNTTYLAIGAAVLVVLLVGGWWILKTRNFQFPISNFQTGKGIQIAGSNLGTGGPEQVPVAALTQGYQDAAFGFSFKYPAGYVVQSASEADTGGTTIAVENTGGAALPDGSPDAGGVDEKGKGIQIFITPYADADTDITAEKIQNDIPDMQVENPQEVIIGPSTGSGQASKGLAFTSDNPNFDGASREVWFVYQGQLYQISTYREYDELLRTLLASWKFE